MATLAQITEAVYRARYEDQVTAGANAATRALQSNAQAAKENADAMKVVNNEVKATGPSISAVNAKLDENTRLARATAKANKEYEQTITALRREAERSTEAASRLAEMERRAGVLRDQQIAKARAAAEAMRQVYASSSGGGASASVDSISSSLASMAVRAAAVAISFQAVTNALRNMVTTADAAVSGAARIGVAVGNLEQGRAIYDQLALGAQKYGLSVTDAAAAFGRLSIAASQIGATNQQTLQLVETLQKLAVVSGTTATEAGSAIQQLGQALGSGRLQGDELRAILEAMPPLAAGLAAQLGVSIAQMRQMGAEGKLTSEVVFPAILRMTQGVNAQLAQMPVTVERATASLNQAWANLVVEVDRATGASSTLARWLQAASNSVQEMATRWRGASLAEEFKRVGDQLERIDRLERERNEPSLRATRNRGSIGTGAALAAQEQGAVTTPEMTAALREYQKELGLLLREESDMIANRQLLEQATAAARAEQARFATETERIKEAQESLGGASTKTREQIAALQSAVAAGDQSMARYGVTAGQAAAMLAALQGKADAALGVIQRLNQELQQGRADAISGFAGRLNARLVEAASQFGGDATQLDPVRVMQIGQQLAQLAEQQGQATLRQAQAETELARARASGNAMAEARVRAEQRHQERMGQGVTETTSLAIKEQELSQARLAGTSAAQGRLQPMAEVLRGLREEATQAANLARASGLSAQAQRVASEQDKARAEALKVARDRTAAYNVAYAQFLGLIQQTSRDQAVADVNTRRRAMEDEIALIERETQLIGELPIVREAEIAALRVRQEMLATGKAFTEEEIVAVQDLARARAQANVVQREAEASLSRIRSTSEEIARDVSTMMYEQLMDRDKSESVVDWFKALFKRIAIAAIQAQIVLPITTQIVGAVPGLFGISTPAGAAGAAATANGVAGGSALLGSGTSGLSALSAGRTIMGSFPSFSGYGNGLVSSGIGSAFNPGYQMSGVYGYGDALLNTPIYGQGLGGATNAALANASYGYGPATAAEVNAAAAAGGGYGMTLGQAGLGVAGIAGGAYGVYTGLQTGGAKGYTQAAGGAVGMAGGAAGLAVASGATSAGGILAGSALGTAAAATAAWAPYVAAALIIASMLMPGPKQSNAAAGANIDLQTGVVNLENSGKETDATAGARDQMVTLIKDTSANLSTALRGAKASGVIGFELGQRDPSRVVLNGNQVGTANVGDSQALADVIGRALLQSFASSPNLADVERRIIDASGSNVDFAMNLLTQTKGLVDTFGSDALNPDRNPATRAIYDAAVQTGNIENVVAALKGAAELTAAYGDALNTADAMKVISAGGGNVQKIVGDLQWFFSVYQPLTDATVQVSALDAAIKASNATYDAAIVKARELGLEEAKLVTNREKAAEAIRQQLRDSYDAAMLAATGGSAVTQAVGAASAIRANWNANATDYLAVGRDPNALYAAQMEAAFKDLDVATLERVVKELKGLDEVAVLFAEAALDAAKATEEAAKATEEANKNLERLATAMSYDAQLRSALDQDFMTQIIEAANSASTNAEAYREVGRDPLVLLAAQIDKIISGLDASDLDVAAQSLQGLDTVTAGFVAAAIEAARAALAMAEATTLAAQRMADAADYDAKMRQAMGLDLVNTIVQIGNEIDAMASRYAAAGRDPAALYTAQVNNALQGKDEATLAKTAAALQGLDASAQALTTTALEQTIAANVAAAQKEIADQKARDELQAQQDAARAAEQAQRDAASAAESAAREQEQAAQEAQQAAEQLASAGQSIRNYINGLKSSPQAGYSPSQALANAQSAYNSDLALAQGGNLDALGRITGSADALIEAAKGMYATGPQFIALRDQIIAQLTALPAVQSADQQIINELAGVNSKLTTANTNLGTTNTSLGTANSSLSGISTSTSSTSSKVAEANTYLASIDTNNDGFVSIAEIEAAAKTRITEAQAALTTAAQSTATNTGATTTAVGGVTTAVGGTTTAIGTNTSKADEVKNEVTSNNIMTADTKTMIEVLKNSAISESSGFVALSDHLMLANKYSAAVAYNTQYSRPASASPGILISSAKGNAFDGGDLVMSRYVGPLHEMGEAGPEAVMPLRRGPSGDLGVSLWGMPANDRFSNDNRAIERFERAMRQMQRASDRNMVALAQAIVAAQNNTTDAVRELKGPLKLALSA